MKASKQLKKTIEKLVESSFLDGRMLESKVVKAVKVLKTLSKTESILALSEYLIGLKRIERQHTMYLETAIPFSAAQIKKAKVIIISNLNQEEDRTRAMEMGALDFLVKSDTTLTDIVNSVQKFI